MPISQRFLTVCNKCKALCCTLVLPPITENERNDIIDAGFPDYFTKKANGIYTIKPTNQGKCPYLSHNDSCIVHKVKPQLCRVWPIVPRIKNNKKEYIIIKCPIFPLLSEDDIKNSKKEAEKIPSEIINQLWNISNELKEKYKKFEYEVI